MAFNPADYETVDSRIKRFYRDCPNGRIHTELLEKTVLDTGFTRWLMIARIYRYPGDTVWANGYAQETERPYNKEKKAQNANVYSALENCETSAIGRALANAGYSGDRRASREEMTRVAREQYLDAISKAPDARELGRIADDAAKTGVLDAIRADLDGRKKELESARLLEQVGSDQVTVEALRAMWKTAETGGYLTAELSEAIKHRVAQLNTAAPDSDATDGGE